MSQTKDFTLVDSAEDGVYLEANEWDAFTGTYKTATVRLEAREAQVLAATLILASVPRPAEDDQSSCAGAHERLGASGR